jgi:hypothetical protein
MELFDDPGHQTDRRVRQAVSKSLRPGDAGSAGIRLPVRTSA